MTICPQDGAIIKVGGIIVQNLGVPVVCFSHLIYCANSNIAVCPGRNFLARVLTTIGFETRSKEAFAIANDT